MSITKTVAAFAIAGLVAGGIGVGTSAVVASVSAPGISTSDTQVLAWYNKSKGKNKKYNQHKRYGGDVKHHHQR